METNISKLIHDCLAKFTRENGTDSDILYLGEIEYKALEEYTEDQMRTLAVSDRNRPRSHFVEFNGITVIEVKLKTYINFGPKQKECKWNKYNENKV